MLCIMCLRQVVTSIDVSREISKEIFVEDSLRCIYIRDCISCFRQVDVLLKNVALNSSDGSCVINYDNVKSIVFAVSISYINIRSRSWCNCFPESSCVGETQSLLLIPVNSCCRSVNSVTRISSCAVNT